MNWNQAVSKSAVGYLLAATGVVLATLISLTIRGHLTGVYAPLVYLLIIVASATLLGVGPAILASALSFLAWNFFFIEPVHTFYVHDPGDWFALFVFLVVGIVCGQLAGRARQAGQVDALREADKLKSAVLSSVSHDLRTPLSSIMASVTSLAEDRDRIDRTSQDELLQSIHEGAKRLDILIGDLLDLSSIEAGVWRPGKQMNHLGNIIGTVLERFDEVGNQRIQVDFAPTLPGVPVDSVQIVQVLWNLLDNALKYSAADRPVLVTAREAGDAIMVSVSDCGPGVPQAERERIFEKFYRARLHTQRSAGGTGMGLAICRGIIEAHGGRIWVDMSPEGGAAFHFTLPRLPAESAPSNRRSR